jgi:hypothetical protein
MVARTVFPLLDQGRTPRQMREDPRPAGVPYAYAANRNHGQTLDRLADRGGLCPTEMLAVVNNWTARQLSRFEISEDEAVVRLHDTLMALGMDFASPSKRR